MHDTVLWVTSVTQMGCYVISCNAVIVVGVPDPHAHVRFKLSLQLKLLN